MFAAADASVCGALAGEGAAGVAVLLAGAAELVSVALIWCVSHGATVPIGFRRR
jgi:hypothetical protein